MWQPQPGAQAAAFSARFVDEVFYGGERGGGKSDFQLGYQEDAALRYEGKSRGIMFRKTYAELEELQGRALELFPQTGAVYKTAASADYPFTNCWYWPNGATVKMRYIEHERDYGRYHGHQYSHQSFDEVTEYPTPNGMIKMFSCLRNAHGVPCSVRATGNPGGVGHGWVKSRYIDNGALPMTEFIDPESGFSRMFIPSRTHDNRILLDSDPNYIGRIIAATNGNEALRKAWLEGDWNIVAGAFFDCWSMSRHVIRPFEIPPYWHKYISGDWGSARPFSFGCWAIVGDDYRTEEGLTLPRGCLVRFKEWYGMKYNEHKQPLFNTGLKLTAEEVGEGILSRSKGIELGPGIMDPAAFSEDGGPSIAERLHRLGVKFRRADNARVPRRGAMGGWDQMRARLIGEEADRPMIVCFNNCLDSIRTIPILQHDTDKLEDLDTDQEDHCFSAGTLVETDNGLIPIEQLSECGRVWTLHGIRDYRSARLVKKQADVIKLRFNNGREVICTPDHKFLVGQREWRYAKHLLNENVLCNPLLLAKQYKNLMESDSINVDVISNKKEHDYTGKYGHSITERYLKDFISIISTAMHKITLYRILNAFQLWRTYQKSTELSQDQEALNQSIRPEQQRQSGTDQKKAKSGIENTMKSIFVPSWIKRRLPFVMNAGMNILRVLQGCLKVNIVDKTVERVRCVSVERVQEKRDVYCITVPSTGHFAIEGGLIVANCADEWRYSCMSRPYARKIVQFQTTEQQLKNNSIQSITMGKLTAQHFKRMREKRERN